MGLPPLCAHPAACMGILQAVHLLQAAAHSTVATPSLHASFAAAFKKHAGMRAVVSVSGGTVEWIQITQSAFAEEEDPSKKRVASRTGATRTHL